MSKVVISRDFLDTLSTFYVKTTKGEHFEINQADNGYILKDITPPILELEINNYQSSLVSQKSYENIMNGGAESTWANDDGIGEGAHFAFVKKSETDYLLSKGKIEQCYHEILFGGIALRIHLFDFPGKKILLDDLLNNSFTLATRTGQQCFVFDGTHLLFEGHEVLRICSIIGKNKDLNLGEFMNGIVNTSDTTLYLNKPFLILWKDIKDDKKVHMSIIGEPLISVTKN